MVDPQLTQEGQEALAGILATRAAMVQEGMRKRLFRILSLLMNEQGAEEAGKDLVIEAAKLALPRQYDSLIHSVEDPAKFKRLRIDPRVNVEAYFALPVEVRRWNRLVGKPAKRPEEMKVLAFCASPRKGGNTNCLIDEALRGAGDVGARVEKIMLGQIKLGFCRDCNKCLETEIEGFCVLKDDMSRYVYQKMVESDAIIIGFPIYLGRECAQLAAFFDRWHPLVRSQFLSGKRGLAIGTWGYPYADTYDQVMERIIGIMSHFGIEPVEAISACGFQGVLRGFDDRGEPLVTRFPGELEKAYQAGKSLVAG